MSKLQQKLSCSLAYERELPSASGRLCTPVQNSTMLSSFRTQGRYPPVLLCGLLLTIVLLAGISPVTQAAQIAVRVSSNNDDAEEQNPTPGSMYRTSTDLELAYDGNTRQIIGIRFQGINVPQGATINSAYIQFTTDETDGGTTDVVFYGEAIDNAMAYGSGNGNITGRSKTGAFSNWSIPAWNTVGETHNSPDLTSIVQEIVNRIGWTPNNAMAFIIEPAATCNSSACQRTAESHNGSSADAPLLVIDYVSSAPSGDSFILSTTGSATLGGLSFSDDDLVEYDLGLDSSTLFFDGGPNFTADEDIDAAHVLANGHIVLSTETDAIIGGISIGDDDLAEYDPSTGAATLIFDGGIIFSNTGEDIDAVFVRDNGNILLSVRGNAAIGGLSFADEDIIEYDPNTGIATLFFDGSTVYDSDEDTGAVHITNAGHILLSTKNSASINGTSFGDDDIVEYDPVADTATVIFNGGSLFSNSNEDIDAIAGQGIATIPTPVAEWRLDESSWNGSPNEVIDSSGNGNHGTGLPGVQNAPAGQVCSAADIPSNTTDSEQQGIDSGLDVDDEIGNRGSISFWYNSNANWTGGGDRALFDGSLNPYYFYLMLRGNGELRFALEDSSDLDLQLDTAAQSFNAGEWVHIAVTWDYSTDFFRVFINGSLAATDNTNTNGIIGELDTLYLGDNRSGYHPQGTANSANGIIDEWVVFQQALTPAQIDSIYQNQLTGTNWDGGSRTCPPVSGIPFGFNCVEAGLDPLTGRLYTKTVGQSFSVDVVALKDSDGNGIADGVETNYASDSDRTVTVELVDTSTVAACSGYPALIPPVTQALVFTAADMGRKASAAMSVTKAYRSLGCRVTDNTDPGNPIVGCSTDLFAVRPTAITVTSNMTNGGSSGAPNAKAGASFTLTATAIAGYDGTPSLDNSNLDPHAGAVQTGSVSGSFGAADPLTGIATGSSFTYTEVGNFRYLAEGVHDDSFTAIDSVGGDCTDDFSNTVVSGKVGCKFANTGATAFFGRFTPDHFTLLGGSITNRIDKSCAPVSNFTYLDEHLQAVFSLSARNLAGTTTQNYIGAYAKLDLTVPGNFNLAALDIDTVTTNLTARLMPRSPSSGSWVNGIASNVMADLKIIRLVTNPDGPYAMLNIGIDPVDADFVKLDSYDLDVDQNTINDHAAVGQTEVRYGRLNIANAYGSELITLPVPLTAQQYSGTSIGFVTNTEDGCTPLAVSDLILSNAVESGQTDGDIRIQSSPDITTQATLGGARLSMGDAGLSFCPPGNPACTPAAGNSGYVDIEVNTPPYLQYDWFGSGPASPKGRASFGLYKGRSNQIYTREVY